LKLPNLKRKEVEEMRMKTMHALRVAQWWIEAFFEVQLPIDALLGLPHPVERR
jgi:hypothetical protein